MEDSDTHVCSILEPFLTQAGTQLLLFELPVCTIYVHSYPCDLRRDQVLSFVLAAVLA